nr:MAG TPA: hypothetical protein [Caudoviricetes sp.]
MINLGISAAKHPSDRMCAHRLLRDHAIGSL